MDNKLALEVLMLLSAYESWILAFGKPIPAHLSETMQHVVSELTKQILKGEANECSDNCTGINGNCK